MTRINRRSFLQLSAATALGLTGASTAARSASQRRPNILFAIADDWSWPHASILGAPEIATPHFDRVAREGCLFTTAITAAPQCSPNRAATLTGRHIWQIEEAGTHASIFPSKYGAFTDLLEQTGYHVGYTCKGWAPGDWKRGGWKRNPAGNEYSARKLKRVPARGIKRLDYAGNFEAFLDNRPEDAPFFFWFGASEPHRIYERGSGAKAGKNPANVSVPSFLPDTPEVREDLLDYFLEVEWFDTQLGQMLASLEEQGELDRTLVVVTGDNGMPFPRAKANLYDHGTHVPLAIRWPETVEKPREITAPVSFIDFAPTFLEAAGQEVPAAMTGLGFLAGLSGGDMPRAHVLTGRERHTHARFDNLGYPARAIRTEDYLYIRNFKPDRWPAGVPDQYHDIDSSPTKALLLENKDAYPIFFELAVGKRPEEELYALRGDPGCVTNVAQHADHAETCAALRDTLMAALTEQGDPRALGTGDIFESYPRVSNMRPQLGGFAERGQYNPKYQP